MRKMFSEKQIEKMAKIPGITSDGENITLEGNLTLDVNKSINTNFIIGNGNNLSIASDQSEMAALYLDKNNTLGGSFSVEVGDINDNYDYGKISINNNGIDIQTQNEDGETIGKINLYSGGVSIIADEGATGTGSISLMATTYEGGCIDINNDEGVRITYVVSSGDYYGKIEILNDGVHLYGNPDGIGGNLFIHEIPTSDPHVANAVWNDNGVLKISAGA